MMVQRSDGQVKTVYLCRGERKQEVLIVISYSSGYIHVKVISLCRIFEKTCMFFTEFYQHSI